MKKCKWCNSNIEDDANVCPYCKANQNISDTQTNTNHVEEYLNGNFPKSRNNMSTTNHTNKEELFYNDIHQIAGDLRLIKNIIVICLVLSIIFGFIGGLNFL